MQTMGTASSGQTRFSAEHTSPLRSAGYGNHLDSSQVIFVPSFPHKIELKKSENLPGGVTNSAYSSDESSVHSADRGTEPTIWDTKPLESGRSDSSAWTENLVVCTICSNRLTTDQRGSRNLPYLDAVCDECYDANHSDAEGLDMNGEEGQFDLVMEDPGFIQDFAIHKSDEFDDDNDSLADNFFTQTTLPKEDAASVVSSNSSPLRDEETELRSSIVMMCNACDQGYQARKLCNECGYVCDECVDAHLKFRQLQRHAVSAVPELQTKQNATTKLQLGLSPYDDGPKSRHACGNHPDHEVVLYCTSDGCRIPICAMCTLDEHDKLKGHVHVKLLDAMDEALTQITKVSKILVGKKDRVLTAKASIEEAKVQLTNQYKTKADEMQKIAKDLHKLVDERHLAAATKLDQLHQGEAKRLQGKSSTVQSLSDQIGNADDLVKNSSQNTDPVEIIEFRDRLKDCLGVLESKELPEKNAINSLFKYTEEHHTAVGEMKESVTHLFDFYELAQSPSKEIVKSASLINDGFPSHSSGSSGGSLGTMYELNESMKPSEQRESSLESVDHGTGSNQKPSDTSLDVDGRQGVVRKLGGQEAENVTSGIDADDTLVNPCMSTSGNDPDDSFANPDDNEFAGGLVQYHEALIHNEPSEEASSQSQTPNGTLHHDDADKPSSLMGDVDALFDKLHEELDIETRPEEHATKNNGDVEDTNINGDSSSVQESFEETDTATKHATKSSESNTSESGAHAQIVAQQDKNPDKPTHSVIQNFNQETHESSKDNDKAVEIELAEIDYEHTRDAGTRKTNLSETSFDDKLSNGFHGDVEKHSDRDQLLKSEQRVARVAKGNKKSSGDSKWDFNAMIDEILDGESSTSTSYHINAAFEGDDGQSLSKHSRHQNGVDEKSGGELARDSKANDGVDSVDLDGDENGGTGHHLGGNAAAIYELNGDFYASHQGLREQNEEGTSRSRSQSSSRNSSRITDHQNGHSPDSTNQNGHSSRSSRSSDSNGHTRDYANQHDDYAQKPSQNSELNGYKHESPHKSDENQSDLEWDYPDPAVSGIAALYELNDDSYLKKSQSRDSKRSKSRSRHASRSSSTSVDDLKLPEWNYLENRLEDTNTTIAHGINDNFILKERPPAESASENSSQLSRNSSQSSDTSSNFMGWIRRSRSFSRNKSRNSSRDRSISRSTSRGREDEESSKTRDSSATRDSSQTRDSSDTGFMGWIRRSRSSSRKGRDSSGNDSRASSRNRSRSSSQSSTASFDDHDDSTPSDLSRSSRSSSRNSRSSFKSEHSGNYHQSPIPSRGSESGIRRSNSGILKNGFGYRGSESEYRRGSEPGFRIEYELNGTGRNSESGTRSITTCSLGDSPPRTSYINDYYEHDEYDINSHGNRNGYHGNGFNDHINYDDFDNVSINNYRDHDDRNTGSNSTSTSKLDPQNCIATLDKNLRLSKPCKTVVKTFDSYGKPLRTGGADLQIQLEFDDAGWQKAEGQIIVYDHVDGTYTVQFTPCWYGNHRLSIAIDGVSIMNSPFLFWVPYNM